MRMRKNRGSAKYLDSLLHLNSPRKETRFRPGPKVSAINMTTYAHKMRASPSTMNPNQTKKLLDLKKSTVNENTVKTEKRVKDGKD